MSHDQPQHDQLKMLVTGGGGFLGLYIVEQLLAKGHSVRVFCRGQYPALERLGVEVVHGDLRNADVVSAACAGIHAVFHVAAIPGVWGPWSRYFETNTLGTRNIIAACRRNGVQRLIYTSSPSVIFDGTDHIDADESLPYPTHWLCHYPHSKALAEQEVLAANVSESLRTVSLRPHLIWGPRDNHLIPRILQRAKSGRLRQVGDGSNVVSISYVENAAAAHVQAEERLRTSTTPAGKAYFINEPQAVNLWTWVSDLLERAGLPRVQKSISLRAAYSVGAVLETVYGVFRISGEPPMTRFVAQQLAGSHSYSIHRAVNDFGYSPLISMDEGLRRMEPEFVRWLR